MCVFVVRVRVCVCVCVCVRVCVKLYVIYAITLKLEQ